jgi:hypothetical protein
MSEQLELDIDDTEEQQTEKGLDKVIEAQEKRRQKDYEENKYRNRELQRRQQERDNQQLEIPDMFKAGSTARTLTGLGVEIGGNFFLDAFSFVPGSQQAGSAALNYLQQVIRGGPISKGEILAAAASSQIPFLQQARTIKKGGKLIREAKNLSRGGKAVRSVVRGSAAGAIDSTVRPIIDEKRAPTVGEFGTGVTAGGLFGGMFDLAPAFTKGGAKKVGQELSEITQDGQKFLGDLTNALTPGPVRIMTRGDLIGAVSDGVGTSSSTRRIVPDDPDNILTPYIGHLTNKFRKQPWEDYLTSGSPDADRLLVNLTGFPSKLDAPQPKGQTYYTVLKSKGASGTIRGRQPLQDVKDDIDLTDKSKYRFTTPAQAERSANSFRNKIIRMMQIDRIRGEDAGTLAGFNKGSRKINTVTGGIKDVGETYYDYLTGFFNRYIRRGTVDNFDDAVKIKIPKVQGRQILPGVETDIVQGDASLIRELRLFTMAPDVYKSGAFTPSNPTYQSQVKSLIRKYSTVNKPMTYNRRRDIFEYKVDAHHIDQIAQGWPLYRGLPKEEIPKMRLLLKQYDLEPGNHEKNVLFLLNEFHKEYHNVYWPRAYAELRAHPDGWDIDVIREIQTASGRMDYARRYAEAVTKSRDEIVQRIKDELDELARIKNKARADLTLQEVQAMSLDIPDIDDIAPPNIGAQLVQDPPDPRWGDFD